MFISKLTLTNFQKHSSLELVFTPGVNYLYGSSDAGKSCIRRAIGFLFFNDPKSDDIRKEGTKNTSVCAVLDSGIEVERVKSSSVNRYVVRKDGVEQTYDSIGGKIPEDVAKILKVGLIQVDDKESLNLNIAEQIALPFLMDKPGSFRLKLFNILTGNDVCDKIQQNLNKEVLSIGRDIKSESEFIEVNTPKLEEVTIQLTAKQQVLGNLKRIKDEVAKKVETYKSLLKLQKDLQRISNDITQTKEALEVIKIIPDITINNIRVMIDTWVRLDNLQSALNENKQARSEAETALLAIKTVKVDTEYLRKKIERLEALKRIKKAFSDSFDQQQSIILNINTTNDNIKVLNKQYKDMLKEAAICPICKQSTENCKDG